MFMPKTLLTLGFFLAAITACKKDDVDPVPPEFYLQLKIDGIQKKYSEITLANVDNTAPIYTCECVGQKNINYLFQEGLIISIASDSLISTNIVYNDQNGAGFHYTDSSGQDYASMGSVGPPTIAVTITQLDDKTIRGTFSGVMTSLQDFTTQVNVTEGKFHLPMHP